MLCLAKVCGGGKGRGWGEGGDRDERLEKSMPIYILGEWANT